MSVLYLIEQRAWVGKEGECLIVHIPEPGEEAEGKKKRERKMTVPLMKIEEVMVLGEITISTPALACLLDAKVQVTYLTQHGRYLGQLSPAFTKNSLLRIAQHEAYRDIRSRHALAQRFVQGKLRNMRTILMRYQRTHKDTEMSEQIESIKRCIEASQHTMPPGVAHEKDNEGSDPPVEMEPDEIVNGRMNGLGSLLGCEGAGSAAYFRVFEKLIKCDWDHGFTKRMRRPPTDPVNAMLSYGYVILSSQVASALAAVGLDPYIGYLHASRYGKPALALDLMEEFRSLIVDSVVLSLLNNHQLEPKGFISDLNAYHMTEVTKRLFLQKFEDRMQETIKHPQFEYAVTYRRCLELQARLLGKHLIGEIDSYTSFLAR